MTVAEPKPPSLQERVAARIGTLTATERRVAEYLSTHPQEAAFSSAEELGRATGTSDASVVRTAKALGFDGLPGLKRSLQGHLQSLLTPANRLSASLETVGDGPEAVLSATLRDHIERLTQAERSIDSAEFRRAVELIDQARETVICGFAGLDGVSEYIATHLTRIGHRARAASDTGYRLADRLLLITAGGRGDRDRAQPDHPRDPRDPGSLHRDRRTGDPADGHARRGVARRGRRRCCPHR